MLYLMGNFARLLEKPEDTAAFSLQAESVRQAFNKKFFHPETQQYDNNTVTANLLPLCFGMVPKEYENSVFQNIVNKTTHEFGSHVSTGVVGIQFLMRTLTRFGRSNLALKIATNRDYPMKPDIFEGLDYVKASFHSVYGLIESDWEKKNDTFRWNITVPCNTTATVYIPANNVNAVTENGKPVSSMKEIKFIKTDGGYSVFQVGSGKYKFECSFR